MIKLPKNNTPRSLIFIQDIVLCLFALIVAYLVRFDFVNIDRIILEKEWEVLKPALPIYIFVRALSFLLGKTYAGIIRHTGTQDAKRIFLTVTLGTSFTRFCIRVHPTGQPTNQSSNAPIN